MMLEMITEQVPLTGLQHGIIEVLAGVLVILLIRVLVDKGKSPPEMMAEANATPPNLFKECPIDLSKSRIESLEGAPCTFAGEFSTQGVRLTSLEGRTPCKGSDDDGPF